MILLAAQSIELTNFVLLGVVILGIGIILRRFKQPYVIAYILAGIFLGRHGLSILSDEKVIQVFGEFGLILLLFFIGMEINLSNLIKNWKAPTIGTLIQIIASVFLVGIIGYFYNWQINRIIIIGFIISLSSSAVAIKLLQDSNESTTKIGKNVISILVMQDILIVPLLIIVNFLGGNKPTTQEIILQLVGGTIIIGVIVWVLKKKEFTLPFVEKLKDDNELQVIIAFIFCFGFALFTALFGLSAALGAFIGGMLVNASRSTEWFQESLHSFRIVFVALFFVSVGMLINLSFLYDNWKIVLLLLLAVSISNHFINALVFQYLEKDWANSLYGGALLAQIGELSFILASSAFFGNVISEFEYQLTIIVISLTLLISPFWIALTKGLINKKFSKL